MEQARKFPWETASDDRLGPPKPRQDGAKTGFEGLDKVLRLGLTPKDRAADLHRDRHETAKRDLSAAIEMVRDAAEAIRAAETRAQDMEARAEALAQRAGEELQAAEARIQALEARAKAAEARVQDAEEWLARLHDAIIDQLAPSRTDGFSASGT